MFGFKTPPTHKKPSRFLAQHFPINALFLGCLRLWHIACSCHATNELNLPQSTNQMISAPGDENCPGHALRIEAEKGTEGDPTPRLCTSARHFEKSQLVVLTG